MRQFCRVEEVARLLGVTEQTVRNWIRRGEIKAQRIGRPHLIPISEVARVLGKTQEEANSLLDEYRGPVVLAGASA